MKRISGVGTPRMDFYPQQNERLDIYIPKMIWAAWKKGGLHSSSGFKKDGRFWYRKMWIFWGVFVEMWLLQLGWPALATEFKHHKSHGTSIVEEVQNDPT